MLFRQFVQQALFPDGCGLGEPVAAGVAFVAGAFAGDEGILDGVVEPVAESGGGRFVEARGPFVEDVDVIALRVGFSSSSRATGVHGSLPPVARRSPRGERRQQPNRQPLPG